MATTIPPSTPSPVLQEVLATHREEARRPRKLHGDQVAWLAAIVRESFDERALEETLRELNEGHSLWDDEADGSPTP